MKKRTLLKSISLGLFLGFSACSPNKFATESEQLAPPQVEPQTQLPQEKNFEIADGNKTDILIITDNSSSMRDEQTNMAQRMSHFLEQIQDLDWRIAVTTTDPRDKLFGDGRLLPMTGLSNSYFYSANQDPSLARQIIGNTIQREEIGSGTEQGIYATYRMLERARAGLSPNKEFLRDDANFVAIVLSDEDESAKGAKNNPLSLLKYIQSQWPTKKFVFHSIIAKPGDHACANSEGHVAGKVYAALSALTGISELGGAIIGSICEDDYGTQLRGMGKSITEMFLSVDLDCEPIGTASDSVRMTWNQGSFTEKYKIKGKKMIFEHPLRPGSYSLKYQCNKS